MARTIAIWGPTGLATPTCKLILRSALTSVVETITLTEHGTVKQLYTGTVTAAAGDYRFNLLTAGSYIGSGTITVSGTDGTTSEEDSENTITTTLNSIVTTLAAMAATVWSYATRTLTSYAGLAGTGARTVAITVQTSGSVAIQGATVRVTSGAETYSQTTNVSGVVTFNLDDATWTVAITKSGYTYAGTTIVVDGDETATYQMTTNSVSAPAAPGLSVGTLICIGTDGLPEAGVDMVFRMTAGPGTDGYAHDSAEFTEVSDVNGEIELDFVIGATYTGRRGTIGKEVAFTVANAASFTLPDVLGAP